MSSSLKVLCLIGGSVAVLAVGCSESRKPGNPRTVARTDGTNSHAPEPEPALTTQVPAPAETVESKLRQALLQKTRFEFVEVPLRDAVQKLAELHKLPFRVDESKLIDEGVQIEQPVTIVVSDITLRSALHLLLEPLQLTYNIRAESIFITTTTDAAEQLETRIYDVERLVTVPGQSDPDYKSLTNVLTSTVNPDSWDELGGEGTLPELPPYYLLIRQTESNHDLIEELLRDIEHMLATPPEKSPVPQCESTPRVAERKIRERLGQPATLEVVDKPLKDVVADLSKAAGITIWLAAAKLTDEGVQLEQPVTLRVADVRLESVLELLLKPVQLAWVIEDEVLNVTTEDDARDRLSTRVYDVRDLATQFTAADRPQSPLFIRVGPQFEFPGYLGGHGVGGGFFQIRELKQFSGGQFGGGFYVADARRWMTGPTEESVKSLIQAIQTGLSPESWGDVGGEGTVTDFRGMLVVRQTYSNHLALQRFLNELRAKNRQRRTIVAHEPPPAEDDVLFVIYDVGDHPADELAKTLPEFVAPETWLAAGGKGIIRSTKGRLLVQQSRQVHRQLLSALDRIVERKASVDVPAAKPSPPPKPTDNSSGPPK